MSKPSSDALFQLIKTLSQSEKRYFKISHKHGEEAKYLRLFHLLEDQERYNESELLKAEFIKPTQLSNLKANLYSKLLQSISSYQRSNVIEIQIREMVDHAQVLFNRGLYQQCADVLKKAKRKAKKIDNLELLLEILKWEKQVFYHTVGPNSQSTIDNIIDDVQDVNERINNINKFTNLAALLDTLYIKTGYVKTDNDTERVNAIFKNSLPDVDEESLSLNEKIPYYSLLVGYYFFIQNFKKGHDYAEKWLKLYDLNKDLKLSDIEGYLKAINNLMIGQYKLKFYKEFLTSLERLRELRHIYKDTAHANIRLRLLKYTYVHEFNRIFLFGEFANGVRLLNRIKSPLEEFISQIDDHSRIILYYKIACLYFGNDNYRESIKWLNKIIGGEIAELREDIHSFARILNLICHYELGNLDVIPYYIRSTYRYMLVKDDLYKYQKAILSFLRKLTGGLSEQDLISSFEKLRKDLLPLQDSVFEKRAFIYFDIISWLESKIRHLPVQEVIAQKAKEEMEVRT